MRARKKSVLPFLLGVSLSIILMQQIMIWTTQSKKPTQDIPQIISQEPAKEVDVYRFDQYPVPGLFRKRNMELYLRVTFSHNWRQALDFLLPSLKLFWPYASIVVAFDAEQEQDQWAAANLQSLVVKFAPVHFRSALGGQYDRYGLQGLRSKSDPGIVWTTRHRHHLDSMYADKVVDANHTVFVEADMVFVTMVTYDPLFSRATRLPRIIGFMNRDALATDSAGMQARKSVELMLKKEYVMNCTGDLPLMIKHDHIRKFREYVESIHNKTFVQVYKEMFLEFPRYCHYSLICNYVWHFHYGDYVFHYHSDVAWRKSKDAPRPDQIKNVSMLLTSAQTTPVVRVSTRVFHDSATEDDLHMYNAFSITGPVFVEGFCRITKVQCLTPGNCLFWKEACERFGIQQDSVQLLLFGFDINRSSEQNAVCLKVQDFHFQKVMFSINWISWGEAVLSEQYPELWRKLTGHYRRADSITEIRHQQAS